VQLTLHSRILRSIPQVLTTSFLFNGVFTQSNRY
jgi:hypothetical protein